MAADCPSNTALLSNSSRPISVLLPSSTEPAVAMRRMSLRACAISAAAPAAAAGAEEGERRVVFGGVRVSGGGSGGGGVDVDGSGHVPIIPDRGGAAAGR